MVYHIKYNMKSETPNAEKVIIEIMRHFGFRRNYQVAKYFEVTPQTLSGWIKSGEIPAKHLIKYTAEILGPQQEKIKQSNTDMNLIQRHDNEKKKLDSKRLLWNRTKTIFIDNLRIIIGIPLIVTLLTTTYVFFIAQPIYTSVAKVLPISEDGSRSNGFSGMAAQLGINIPISIGGNVPWDEVYPEIVKSSDLLTQLLKEKYNTNKYGLLSLIEILIEENSLKKYPESERENRAISEFQKMINISKDRLSPVVTLEVSSFEPIFVADLSDRLIEKSGQIQRQLKTNRVRQKRLFIEERLSEVSPELKKMEKELREFREFNRNISGSPYLEMKVQEMGREIDLQNSLYVTLKTQHEKAKIDEIERDDMVQIIDGPNIPAKLTFPRRGLTIILSLFFGFFIAVFSVYVRENYIGEPLV